MNFSYDKSYDPPAPMVQVRLFAPASRVGQFEQEWLELSALLDSGADITVVPAGAVERLRLPSTGATNVRGFASGTQRTPTFSLRFTLMLTPGQDRSWLDEVVAWDEPFAVIGRGVLNHWRVTLDGPKGIVTIE